MRRRLLSLPLGRLHLVAFLLLAAGVMMIGATEPVHAQEDPGDEPAEWRACGSTTASAPTERVTRAEILLVLDRSGSLGDVDPGGTERRRALERTRGKLTDLQERLSGFLSNTTRGTSFDIDVALAAFDTEAETITDFDSVGTNHPSDEDIAAASTSRRNTDYGPAIEKALELFEASPNSESTTNCRLLVLFTDGILDPLATASGGNPSLESRAKSHVDQLLEDLCGTDPGSRSYRNRMDRRGISTYVAVLKGNDFDRGTGTSHLDDLARASKQAMLGLTGHADSPLLEGVTPGPGCKDWSENRAGKVIDFENIDDLIKELEKAVADIESGLRRPRISCTNDPGEAELDGAWPHELTVGDPLRGQLCTVTTPLDGEARVTLTDKGDAADLDWLIDDDSPPEQFRVLSAGDPDLAFNMVSSALPTDEAFGGFDAEVEITVIWSPDPESQPDMLGESSEYIQTTTVQFAVPDREQHWIDKLITCPDDDPPVRWTGSDNSRQAAEVSRLCSVQAPPAGEFEITLTSEDARLSWSATRSGDSGDPPIRLKPGDPTTSLGAVGLRSADDPITSVFTDTLTISLIWRNELAVLEEMPIGEFEITVPLPSTEHLDCTNEAQVTAVVEATGEAEMVAVVDTGCKLRSPDEGGTVTAKVSGDFNGVFWALTDRPQTADADWLTTNQVDLDAGQPDHPLFVLIKHPDLAELVATDRESSRITSGDFSLITSWTVDGTEIGERESNRIRVLIYLPVPLCSDDPDDPIEASLAQNDQSNSTAPDLRGEARNVCRIDPPPNGRLEVRVTDARSGEEWQVSPPGNQDAMSPVLRVEAGDASVDIDAISGPLAAEQLPIEKQIDVVVTWTSALDFESQGRERVVVNIPDIQQDQPLLSCTGTPEVANSSVEVPDGPLVVDTGCVLLPPDAGTVTLDDVGGDIDGTPWQIVEDFEIGPGDDPVPILIQTTDPLVNQRYDTDIEFDLTEIWKSPSGSEQSFNQEPPRVTVVLRARPSTGMAALITLALLLAGLVVVWLILWILGRRVNRPSEPGAYRVIHQDVTATVAPGGQLELSNFDLASAVDKPAEPLAGRRSRLQGGGLTIRTTVRWWNPKDLLAGGRAKAVPQDQRSLLVAASPSSEQSDCLPVSLAHGAVIVALDPTPVSSATERNEHRGHIWILNNVRANRKTDETLGQKARQNIDKALSSLKSNLGGRPAAGASTPTRPKGPPPTRPKG